MDIMMAPATIARRTATARRIGGVLRLVFGGAGAGGSDGGTT
jgi:hypothetical protein